MRHLIIFMGKKEILFKINGGRDLTHSPLGNSTSSNMEEVKFPISCLPGYLKKNSSSKRRYSSLLPG